MLSKMIKGIILLILLGLLFMVGTCVYANFIQKPDLGIPELPEPKDAGYSVHIKNTGGLLLTNDIEIFGEDEGSKIYVLHGYWELSGQDFIFRDQDIVLNENIFGKITIRGR